MATQAIRFLGPPGETITLDVFTLASDTAEQSGLVCTEATNRKGLYTTANFTDTLAGRFLIIGKVSGIAIGNDFVDILNEDGTYDSHALTTNDAIAAIQSTAAVIALSNVIKSGEAFTASGPNDVDKVVTFTRN
jgi:hypothetical protein